MAAEQRLELQRDLLRAARALWGSGGKAAKQIGVAETTGIGWDTSGNGIPLWHLDKLVKAAEAQRTEIIQRAEAAVLEAAEKRLETGKAFEVIRSVVRAVDESPEEEDES